MISDIFETAFTETVHKKVTARSCFALITSHWRRCVSFFNASMMQQKTQQHTPTAHIHTHTHSSGEHATRCLLPGSVLVDHVAVLLFRRRPNGGGFASARALATKAGWG